MKVQEYVLYCDAGIGLGFMQMKVQEYVLYCDAGIGLGFMQDDGPGVCFVL